MDTNNKNLLMLKQIVKQNECFNKDLSEYTKYKEAVEELYYYIKNLLSSAETMVDNLYNKNRIVIGIDLRLNLLNRNKNNYEIDFKDVTKKYIRNNEQTLEILHYIEKHIDYNTTKKNLELIK